MKRTQRTTGFGSPAETYADNDIDWNTVVFPKPHAMHVSSITGSRYAEYKICDEDLAIIDRSLTPKIGDLVVHIIDGEIGIKQFSGKELEVIGVISRLVRLLR